MEDMAAGRPAGGEAETPAAAAREEAAKAGTLQRSCSGTNECSSSCLPLPFSLFPSSSLTVGYYVFVSSGKVRAGWPPWRGWLAGGDPPRERERESRWWRREGWDVLGGQGPDGLLCALLLSSPLAGGARAGRESLRRALSLRLPEILAGIGPRLLPHARAAFASAPPSFSRFASSSVPPRAPWTRATWEW
jgi:hypothetical protein